ncbi:S8 family serine peptidase [Hyalangium versicolor]|uniref:S8 family serine peptidase n=1 Tax=Hyalangium versicolor TaxID=2861190 RepID=UPI001CCF594D|nr:S8 family serine peptidase [Hyalangium versicolor]
MSTRVLGAVWILATLACEGSGSAPAASPQQPRPEGFRAGLATHKVQLSAEQQKQLEAQGARFEIIGDYGSFKIAAVDEAALDALPAAAEARDDFNDILLNAGVIDTASSQGQSLRGLNLPASGKSLKIVQFAGPIQESWVKELEATGVKVITYIPNNAYIVYGDAASLAKLQRHVTATPSIQWNGDYLNDYKLDPSIQTSQVPTYAIQLIKDEEANGPTLELIRAKQSRAGTIRESLGYVNVVAYLTAKDLYDIAARPDVLSIQPRSEPRKFDERQNIILTGQLTGNGPTAPGYLAWLATKGFTQAQFTASGFGVDVSDSGLDNGTTTPNHFGYYEGGNINGASRIVYNRIEGSGSTTQGCDGHGTLNAHIIGGYTNLTGAPFQDAAGYSYGLGVAPFVKLGGSVIFGPDYTDPVYEDLQSRAYRDGMRISSNSWGYTSGNTYNIDCQQYDSLVRDAQQAGHAEPNVAGNQEMIIVFAAGNNGSAANTVAPPGTAKNVITVGAAENVQAFGGADACGTTDAEANSANDIVGFSGRGPSSDGRKKPDIMAPGTHVSGGVAQDASQRANPPANPLGKALSCFDASGVCGGSGSDFFPSTQQWYSASSGTSHSTPAVAGGTALVRQYFINQGMTPPSAAMTKAYLMNSARYMTGTAANDNLWSNNQGMGMMDLGRAFDGTPRKLDDQTSANLFTATGQTRTFTGVVADSTKPFRVTLAWTDAPGSTTGGAWKNNLDLSVTLGANTYKGNVFTGANSITGGTADSANNVESVFLPAGAEGSFTITVTATNITSDGVPGNASALDQDFALVAYNICDTVAQTPTGVAAVVNGSNRVDVSWIENGAASYNVYRSTTAGGPYTLVGSATTSPFSDTTVSGGITYYYVVRAVQCSESPKSTEVSVTASGACTLKPTFAGLTSAANGMASTCSNTLTWAAGTPICGGTLSYSVYRGTASGFTPSAANKIATGITGTTFNDDLNLTQSTTYYYVVRATETSSAAVEETNTVQKSAAPTGAVSPGLRYFDDLDNNRPTNAASYWIATTQTGTSGTINITTGCHYQSATKAYRFGAANTTCGGTYPLSTQATLSLGGNGSTTGINGFAIPASASSPVMSFNLWYTTEDQYDGAWLVYSTTSAAGPWTNVSDAVTTTAPYVSAGGYDNVLKSSTTTRIWTKTNAGANGSLKAVTVNLGALAGQTVWFGFKFYSDVSTTAEGVYVDDVRITADTFGSCSTQVPPPGPAVAYKLTGLPTTFPAGTSSTVTLTAVDAVGTTAIDYAGTAAFTSSDPQAVLPTDVTFTAGVATGSVSLRKLGTQTLTATDTTNPALTATGSTTVTAGAATALVITVQPITTKAGASIAPAVKVGLVDQFGNAVTTGTNTVSVALGTNPGSSTLSGTASVAMVAGVATFSNLSLDKVGTGYTLVASSTGLTDATSVAFNITSADPAKVAFQAQPSTTQAGESMAPAVKVAILDRFDNVTDSTATVYVVLTTNPNDTRMGGTTAVAAVNGVATFSDLSLDKTGTYTLDSFTDTLAAVTSTGFDITPAVPSRVRITRQPSDTVAAAAITPSIEATLYDRFGNVATQATNAISVSLGNNPTGGALSGTTVVNAAGGTVSFGDLSVDKAGLNYTLVVGGSGLYADTSVGFDVAVGAATQLAFTASPVGSVASGSPFTVKVAVRDAGGNVVTSASAPVTLTFTSASGATLSGTTVATPVNGVATFTGLSVDKVGTGYTIQASASGIASATSPAFGVDPGAAAGLKFATQPSNSTAGAAITPSILVALEDAQGNTLNTSGASITLVLGTNPSSGTLSGVKTATTLNGVASFSGLSVDKVGTGYTLTASAGALSATSAAFDIAHGPTAAAVFTVQPGSAPVGAVITPAVRVTLQDAYGNVATSATDAVTVAIGNNPRNGTLSGTKTANAINGVATFSDLSINRNGKGYTLTASTGSLSATSTAFDITPGKSQKLVFRTTPSQVAAGSTLATIEVELRDELDNLLTDAPTSVTLGLGENPTAAQLLGVSTVQTVDGVAKFDGLSLRKAGNGYTLVASAQGFTGATSAALNVKPGAAASYTLSVVASVTAGQEASLSASAYDAYGNPAAEYGGSVKVTSSDPTAAFASTAQFVEGVLPSFKVTFKSPGLRTLTVTDSENASLTGTAQLNVTPFAQPTASVTDPAGGTTVSGKVNITVTGAVAPGTTLAQLSILVDGVVVASGTDATLSGSWDSATATEGTAHTITALITDGAGNVASSAPVIVTVQSGSCGCGATSGTDAGIYLGLLVLARYLLGRRREKAAA